MGFFDKLREGLTRTKQQIVSRFDEIVKQADAPEQRTRPVDVDTIEALEELLLSADVGVAATERIVTAVKGRARRGESLRDLVKDEIRKIFDGVEQPPVNGHHPQVTLIVGVNGTGKTTTVGKLANLFKASGSRPLVCAADTFRAAAVEQLEIWARRADVDIVRAKDGSDPAAVVFDAIQSGKARGRDPILIDTAGRLHNRVNLMNELDKIRRVAARATEGAPHEVLLVLDATVGQNGVQQAREFTSVAGVTGIVLTKLDGTAKGGVAVAIANDLKLPIKYVGVGEGIDDLIPFSPQEYVDALFQTRPDAAAEADERWMRRALQHARRGLGRTTPNPVVGACIVTPDGVVVGQGAHERAGEPHAEIHALDEAGGAARGATLYCTLEPCAHSGRTGPCTGRIIAAGIRRVVAAMEDPFPLVGGRGFSALRASGIDVSVGVGRDAAARLNQPFLTAIRDGRPFVMIKAASSIDGRIAAAPGVRSALTSAAARRRAQYDRACVDAVGVGSETILVDNPLLTARDVYRERPLARVVFDRRLRTPGDARLFSTLSDGPVIILTTPDAAAAAPNRVADLERAGATIVAPAEQGLAAAMRELLHRNIQSLLIEGGTALHAAAWDARVVDYVQLYVTPIVLGAGGVPIESRAFSTAGLFDRKVDVLGPDVIIEGYVHRPH